MLSTTGLVAAIRTTGGSDDRDRRSRWSCPGLKGDGDGDGRVGVGLTCPTCGYDSLTAGGTCLSCAYGIDHDLATTEGLTQLSLLDAGPNERKERDDECGPASASG